MRNKKILKSHRRHHHHDFEACYLEGLEYYRKDLGDFRKFAIKIRLAAIIMSLILTLIMIKFIGFDAITLFFVLIFIVSEIFNIYVFYRLEKRIVTPVKRLKDGVERIANGDYSVRITENNQNEIGILVLEFNKMAKKLEEAENFKKEYEKNRKALIANISHDLKTPITSISGYVEFMIDGNLEKDKIDKYLKTVKSNVNYMNKLIDDLFLFTKLDMEKLEFTFEETNIKRYMEDIVEEFKFVLEEENIRLNYRNAVDDNAYVNIDTKMIHRCIRNIIGNAVKYGNVKNDLEIEIDLYNKKNDIYIDIKDNGPGIEKDKLEHIFERFYRIDKERSKDLMSTGLGLAIAKEIVIANEGEIFVESELNIGSIFKIKLPMINYIERK